MQHWTAGQLRYLVQYSDGGSGMRRTYAQLDIGKELRDGGNRYRVTHVEHPANAHSFGHASAELLTSGKG